MVSLPRQCTKVPTARTNRALETGEREEFKLCFGALKLCVCERLPRYSTKGTWKTRDLTFDTDGVLLFIYILFLILKKVCDLRKLRH